MGRFFTGSLQEGVAFAVSEAKAVVCFVRDDAQASSTWDTEYFDGDEFESVLFTKAVPLSLAAGSPEAGFLTSFCPIVKFPTVVVIKNGTLAEYLVPEISKDEFQSRLIAALTKENEPNQAPPAQNAATPGEQSDAPVASPVPPSTAAVTSQTPQNQATIATPAPTPQVQRSTQESAPPKKAATTQDQKKPVAPKPQPSNPEQTKPASKSKSSDKMSGSVTQKAVPSKRKEAEPAPKAPKPRGPPTQYSLQVRLFDGSSLRASFTPTQKISTDVRPWLDAQMGDEQRPYNLKHILTPLPSRTLSVAEESQTLRDLGLGSTANLVMVPVASYTDAYAAAAGSLPVRGASAVYNAVSSVATSATGYLGSWIGYGAGSTQQNESSSSNSTPASSVNRSRLAGPNIRTLSDQQDDRGDRQFYNGNQLNFEPRQRKDD